MKTSTPANDAGQGKTETLTMRLSPTDRALLDRLVELRVQELYADGEKVTAASLIRSLIRREAKAKGLLETP